MPIGRRCPYCQSGPIAKRGKTETGKQRSRCQHPDGPHHSFVLNPAYKGRVPVTKAQMIGMALTGRGIRDTARVLGISTDTVLNGAPAVIAGFFTVVRVTAIIPSWPEP